MKDVLYFTIWNFYTKKFVFSMYNMGMSFYNLTFLNVIGVILFERSTLPITCLDALLSRIQMLFFDSSARVTNAASKILVTIGKSLMIIF